MAPKMTKFQAWCIRKTWSVGESTTMQHLIHGNSDITLSLTLSSVKDNKKNILLLYFIYIYSNNGVYTPKRCFILYAGICTDIS